MARIAMLCSGQGMQHADMFEHLRKYPECEGFLQNAFDNGFLSPVLKDFFAQSKPLAEDILFDNIYAQELICLYQLMLWEKLKSIMPEERLFAGYSLGEPIAYGCAGLFTTEETFKLIRERGRIMSSCADKPCGMLAVKGLSEEVVKELCAQCQCYIAIYNPGNHFIVGGLLDNICNLESACVSAGAEKVVLLKINIPSHTPLMQSASNEFRLLLDNMEYRPDSGIIMLEGVSGRRVFNRKQAVDALARQISHPVMWARNISAMIEYGCDVFLELGPGRALSRMVNEKIHHGEARSIEEFNDLNELSSWLQKSIARNT